MGFQMEERIHKFLHKSSQDQEMQHPGHQFNVEMSQ